MFSKTLLVLLLVYFSSEFSHGERDKKFFQKDYTYIEAVESYYKIHTKPRTFDKAVQICVLEGSSLFYPENENEANAVIAYFKSVHPNFTWGIILGLTDSETEGEFKTIDGKPISDVYKKWRTGEPNNDKNYREEDCVQLNREGDMNDVACYLEYPFICKKRDYTYIKALDSYYKIHTAPRTFVKAVQICALEGSSLFYPENEDEANAVIAYWRKVYPTTTWGILLGLTDSETEGEFKTIDGKPISDVYKKWQTGEPNNDKSYREEDCVQLYRQGDMNDVTCNIESPFICKKKDYTYIKALNGYYKIHTTPRIFAEAKRVCVLEGAHLFYPKNDDEAYAVIEFWNRAQPQPSAETLFVAMSDLKTEGVFETTEGKLSNDVYHHWLNGEPNNGNGAEDCVTLNRQGYLNDIPCGNKYGFICKSPQWNDVCNMGGYTFSQETGKCYKVHTTTPLKWIEANTVCRAEKSHLAVINNEMEAAYLADLADSTPKRRVEGMYQRGIYHLGFHNMLNEGWQTIKGTPLNVDADAWWDKYTPTGNEIEQCGSMVVNGLLNNINCDTKSFFICEHDADCGKSSLDTC